MQAFHYQLEFCWPVLLVLAAQAGLEKGLCSHVGDRNNTRKLPINEVSKGPSHQGGHGGAKSDLLSMFASMNKDMNLKPAEYYSSNEFEEFSAQANLNWRIKLDQSERYQVSWGVDYNANQITFALDFGQDSTKDGAGFRPGLDVFAFGFSEDGQLESSDFCLIWYDLARSLHFQDALTNSNNTLELVDTLESACKLLDVHSSVKSSHRGGSTGNGGHHSHHQSKHGEKVRVVFQRPLDICPSFLGRPRYRIDNGTTHVVWFTLKGPPLTLDGLNLNSLMRRDSLDSVSAEKVEVESSQSREKVFDFGMKRIQLVAVKPPNSVVQQGSSGKSHSLDIRINDYKIPAKETTYWCKLFKLPRKFETRRFHITRYEAVIDNGNEHVVHHMELFSCANLNETQSKDLEHLYSNEGGWSGECGSSERPPATEPCRRVVLAWAMGAHPLEYPEQVGQSIGGPDYSPFVVLEVHYNNVKSSSGLVDSSGLRFHYTSKLRPFDAGILEVGLEYTDKNSIPPGLLVPMAGYCVSECTRASMISLKTTSAGESPHHIEAGLSVETDEPTRLDITSNNDENQSSHTIRNVGEFDYHGPLHHQDEDEGIHIFASQMHTHLTGVASWTELVREGRLLGELQRDNHYSPHFQEIRLLPEPVHVMPGDALIHYCLYDTRRRVNVTLGGFSTSDEMCVTYLHYYPKIDLEVCKSSIDTEALKNYFAYLAKQEGQKTNQRLPLAEPSSKTASQAQKSVSENYRSIDWSPRRSRELIELYSRAPLAIQCNRSNGERFPGSWNGIAPTKIWSDYAEGDNPEAGVFFNGQTRNGQQLIAYRGRGFHERHPSCLRQPI